jgi:co-chaperonin GroES (HSP10)
MKLLDTKPIGRNVFVEIDNKEEVVGEGGVYVKDTTELDVIYGTVRGVGDDVYDLAVGDQVFLNPDPTRRMNIKILIISEDDILGKIIT